MLVVHPIWGVGSTPRPSNGGDFFTHHLEVKGGIHPILEWIGCRSYTADGVYKKGFLLFLLSIQLKMTGEKMKYGEKRGNEVDGNALSLYI